MSTPASCLGPFSILSKSGGAPLYNKSSRRLTEGTHQLGRRPSSSAISAAKWRGRQRNACVCSGCGLTGVLCECKGIATSLFLEGKKVWIYEVKHVIGFARRFGALFGAGGG